jgi:hypothetical protein
MWAGKRMIRMKGRREEREARKKAESKRKGGTAKVLGETGR